MDPVSFIERSEFGVAIWVAASDEDIAVAYCLLEIPNEQSAHLDMLYCHPKQTRLGMADRLLRQAQSYAENLGAERLNTEASELARPVFERTSYTVMQRRDFEIEHDNTLIPIHNYAMEKRLS